MAGDQPFTVQAIPDFPPLVPCAQSITFSSILKNWDISHLKHKRPKQGVGIG
jgi:hypothetical protein